MKHQGVWILGTDTDVGKTYVTERLGEAFRTAGYRVGMVKPVASGALPDGTSEDATRLMTAAGIDEADRHLVNPVALPGEYSPKLAAELAGYAIAPSSLLKHIASVVATNDITFVEGAGGITTPLIDGYDFADLAADSALPAILVADGRLGCINRVRLTSAYAEIQGISVKGIVINDADDTDPFLLKTNVEEIEATTGLPVMAILPPRGSGTSASDIYRPITADAVIDLLVTHMPKPSEYTPHVAHPADSDIVKLDKRYIWHPFTQMKGWTEEDQLAVDRGEGIFLIDESGRRYYDGVSSLWVNIHGHNRPEINRAIAKQMQRISHSTLLGLVSPPSALLAEKLVNITPETLTKVFYSDDGSTAIEVALKMAYQYRQLTGRPEKNKFISLTAAYHGDTLGTVSVGGISLFHTVFRPLLFAPILLPSPGIYADPSEREAAFESALNELERILKEHHHEITALITEPLVQAAAGMLTMPSGFLRRVRELTEAYDVFLIVDEVATGFGRTGKMFACEHEGISPDFMTLSKGITGGYMPLAATLTTDRVYDAFLGTHAEKKTFYHGHSYTGNAIACAAALANLEIFEKDGTIETLPEKISRAARALEPFKSMTHVKEVRQVGLIIGIELESDTSAHIPYPPEQAVGAKVAYRAREYGLICRPIGDVLILMPPLASTAEDIEAMIAILYRAAKEITEGDAASQPDITPTDL